MEFESKFNLDEKVYYVEFSTEDKFLPKIVECEIQGITISTEVFKVIPERRDSIVYKVFIEKPGIMAGGITKEVKEPFLFASREKALEYMIEKLEKLLYGD